MLNRRLLILGLLLLAVLAAIVFGVIRFWPAEDVAADTITIAPAQEGEFLTIIAPFWRNGGEPQPIGGTLAQALQYQPGTETLYRVEMLSRAPDEETVTDLLNTVSPRILVTGAYDGSDIDVTIHLNPPRYLPSASDSGGSTLVAFFEPALYNLYAPQGLDNPLHYLQSWITGQAYFWRGDFDEASKYLLDAKRLLPRQVPIERRSDMDAFASDLNWQLGYIAGPIQGNWQAARDLFSDAMSQNAGDLAPALGLAAALAQLNDLDRAASILHQALRDHPDSWQIHYALAEIALQQGDVTAGFTNYDRAIALLSENLTNAQRPALADIYFNRGYYRLTHDDPEGALADFQQALSLGREDIYVQGNLGWAAYLVGDYETAIRASAAARKLDPQRPDLAFNEALHLLAAGQTDAARTAYGEAIDLTLQIEDVLTRSTYFGIAYNDLEELGQRQPELTEVIKEIQERIDIANG